LNALLEGALSAYSFKMWAVSDVYWIPVYDLGGYPPRLQPRDYISLSRPPCVIITLNDVISILSDPLGQSVIVRQISGYFVSARPLVTYFDCDHAVPPQAGLIVTKIVGAGKNKPHPDAGYCYM